MVLPYLRYNITMPSLLAPLIFELCLTFQFVYNLDAEGNAFDYFYWPSFTKYPDIMVMVAASWRAEGIKGSV